MNSAETGRGEGSAQDHAGLPVDPQGRALQAGLARADKGRHPVKVQPQSRQIHGLGAVGGVVDTQTALPFQVDTKPPTLLSGTETALYSPRAISGLARRIRIRRL